MTVTGWTYWGNPDYIDVESERIEKMKEYTKNNPYPDIRSGASFDDIKKHMDWNSAQVNKFWEENPFYSKFQTDAYNAVLDEVQKNNYHFTGTYHQNGDCGVPIIDGKYLFEISQRCWGELMFDAFRDEPEFENTDHCYEYIVWAWAVPEGYEEIIPYNKGDNL